MAQIYRLNESGGGDQLERIYCKDEDKELQSALENNYDLLPGDQIAPDDPCRWLMIRREMPVPDPTSGQNRWNIDFLFADQTAMPTFVECKRFHDTDSRRKVVGQMMEYAANGHHYWTTADLYAYAEQSVKAKGGSVVEELKLIGWNNPDEPETFFQAIEENLREGQVRLIFFLEEASFELKSIVEFLNSQMERSEVLLVEARQYRLGQERIISPALFGFTEEARFIKRKVSVESAAGQVWNAEKFFEHADQTLDSSGVQALRYLLDGCERLGCETNWGRGKQHGTYSVKFPSFCSQNLFSIRTDGRMELPFGAMGKSDKDRAVRDQLKDLLATSLHLRFPDDYEVRYPGFRLEEWQNVAEQLVSGLERLTAQSEH
jgi:hypothetical protein